MKEPIERVVLELQRDSVTGETEVMVEHRISKGKRWRPMDGPKWFPLSDDLLVIVRAFLTSWRSH